MQRDRVACSAPRDDLVVALDPVAQYPRYGYRKIRIFLGREGHQMSAGRTERFTTEPSSRDKRPEDPRACHAHLGAAQSEAKAAAL